MNSFKTTLLTQKQDFLALEPEWNNLLANSVAPTIFLTWEWVSTWYQHLHTDQKLWIISVRDTASGSLLAIAPLMIQSRKLNSLISIKELCFLANNVGSDHLDFILNTQHHTDLTEELTTFISVQKKSWDIVHLEGCRNNATAYQIFQLIEGQSYLYPVTCPYLELPKTWDEYLKSLGKKRRYKIRAYKRNLEAAFPNQVNYQQVTTSEELVIAMTELFSLHQQAQEAQGRKGAFSEQARQDFHRHICAKFLKNDWLRLYFLRVKDQPIAMLYSFFYQGRISFYTTGFDLNWSEQSPGQQIIYHALEQSINENAQIFDFLRGDEDYKFMMTKTIDEDQRFIAPHSLLGKSAAWLFNQKKKLKKSS